MKRAFNEAFAGRNKSAIIADLIQRAVAEEERQERRTRAVDRLLELRASTPAVRAERFREARDELRERAPWSWMPA